MTETLSRFKIIPINVMTAASTDKYRAFPPHAQYEENAGQQNESQQLGQVPVVHGAAEVGNAFFVDEHQGLQEQINEHCAGAYSGKIKLEVIMGFSIFGADPVGKNTVADGSLKDDQREAGKDAGDEKQNRDEL